MTQQITSTSFCEAHFLLMLFSFCFVNQGAHGQRHNGLVALFLHPLGQGTKGLRHKAAQRYRRLDPLLFLLLLLQVTAPWRSLQPLTPDATQLADPTWAPHPFKPQPGGSSSSSSSSRGGVQGGVSPKWQQAADWARQGFINSLSLMALDVLMAPRDAKDRCNLFAPLVFSQLYLLSSLMCFGTSLAGSDLRLLMLV